MHHLVSLHGLFEKFAVENCVFESLKQTNVPPDAVLRSHLVSARPECGALVVRGTNLNASESCELLFR
jgi:hypothetical protein